MVEEKKVSTLFLVENIFTRSVHLTPIVSSSNTESTKVRNLNINVIKLTVWH